MKRNIFFILNTGEAVRNFATHGVVEALTSRGLRCVIFKIDRSDHTHYLDNLKDDVIFEDFGADGYRGLPNLIQRIVTYIWRTRIPSYDDVLIRHGGRKSWIHPYQNLLGRMLQWVPVGFWDSLYQLTARWPRGAELIEKYQPAAIIIANPVSPENAAINYAKRRGIHTACLLESWDNLTIRGGLSSFPDQLFVWNEMMKKQATVDHRFPEERVTVTGVCSFDIYQKPGLIPSETEWRREMNIKDGVPVLLYSTSSLSRSKDEYGILEHILEARDQGQLPADLHLLVRIHPRDKIENYDRYLKMPGVTIQSAHATVEGHESTYGRILMLSATMRYTTVIANIFSTMMLDAFAHGKPVVAVAFDATDRPEQRSVRRYLRDVHVKEIMEYDAMPVAYDREQLVEAINHFLQDPDWKKKEREVCTEAHMTHLDGQCSSRFAEALLAGIDAAGSPSPEIPS
jgi:hypothetical protein